MGGPNETPTAVIIPDDWSADHITEALSDIAKFSKTRGGQLVERMLRSKLKEIGHRGIRNNLLKPDELSPVIRDQGVTLFIHELLKFDMALGIVGGARRGYRDRDIDPDELDE
jgi:hypothetical protein